MQSHLIFISSLLDQFTYLTSFQDKNADVESLSEAGVNLVKSGDQEAQSAAHKVDSLCKQIQRLHRTVQVRIQISIVYVTFHKLVQQVKEDFKICWGLFN